jgi:hypothetical protein
MVRARRHSSTSRYTIIVQQTLRPGHRRTIDLKVAIREGETWTMSCRLVCRTSTLNDSVSVPPRTLLTGVFVVSPDRGSLSSTDGAGATPRGARVPSRLLQARTAPIAVVEDVCSIPQRARYRMFGMSSPDNDARGSSCIEVPEDIIEQVRGRCLALPEVTVRVDASRTRSRSTAHPFDIRRRSFCLLVALEGRSGKPVPLLALRVDPEERDALLSIGHSFFASRAGRDRIGVRLTVDTDWEEIGELVTESYRRLARGSSSRFSTSNPLSDPARVPAHSPTVLGAMAGSGR